MADTISLRGPVENIDGKLILRIPLEVGGGALIECTQGIAAVDGKFLSVHIQEWLARKLNISEGSIVAVDNNNGKFNIRLADGVLRPEN